MADNEIKVEVSLTGDAEQRFNRLTDSVKRFSDEGSQHLSKFSAAYEVFKGSLAAEAVTKGFELVTDAAKELYNVLISEGVKAAEEQENAVNALNQALVASGKFSREASLGIQQFAQEMQETTKFADNAVLSAAALIQSLGRLDEDGLKRATKAAADLSAALGIDLERAALLVGKAAEGEVGAFQRYGVAIRKGADDAATFANALDAINVRFGGAAEQQAKTFSGEIAILGHAFEDVQKQIGNAIIQNSSLNNVLQVAGHIAKELAVAVEQNREFLNRLVSDGVLLAIDGFSVLVSVFQGAERAALKTAEAYYTVEAGLEASIELIPGLDKLFKSSQDSAQSVEDIGKKIAGLDAGTGTLNQVQAALERLREAAINGYGAATDGADQLAQRSANAANAVEQLTKAQIALGEQGQKLAEQAAVKDPASEFQARQAALEAAAVQELITVEQRDAALDVYRAERERKETEEVQKRITELTKVDSLLENEDNASRTRRLQSTIAGLRQIQQEEGLTAEARRKVSAKLVEAQGQLDQIRVQAGTDALNQLATLQTTKSKALAAVGKAAAIASTTISTYEGATKAAAALAGIPFVGPALAVAAAAAFVVAGLANVARISGVQLAGGLTEVPSGFSNDTFPARLSSGERVVDANTNADLKDFLSGAHAMVPLLSAILAQLQNQKLSLQINIGTKPIMDEVIEGIQQGRAVFI